MRAAEGGSRHQPDRTGSAPLAALLAGTAGYVDGLGAVLLGGLFVSFMSGNTTSAGLGLASGAWAHADRAALPIAMFVLGVVLGSAWLRRRPGALPLVYLLISTLLLLFALLTRHGRPEALAVALLSLPMGMLNSTLRHVGSVSVGLTYVTGTLASLGEALASLIGGEDRHRALAELRLRGGLWSSFLLGAVLSGLLTRPLGAFAVLLPVVALLGVALRRGVTGWRARA